MLPIIVGVLSVFVLGRVGAMERRETCNCNYVSHPQTHFCQSAYALRGLILDAVSAPKPGEPDMGRRNGYLRYNVSVIEVYKGEGEYLDSPYAAIYTPSSGLCGMLQLYHDPAYGDEGSNEYLIAGNPSETGEGFLVITNCNWIVPWAELTLGQEQGLQGLYADCRCEVHSGTTQLDRIGTEAEDYHGSRTCIFNRVAAKMSSAPDCESDHGSCWVKGPQCQWLRTPEYEECYESRMEQLTNAAAAITTRRNCAGLSGRQKKKCLLKLLKSRNSQKH